MAIKELNNITENIRTNNILDIKAPSQPPNHIMPPNLTISNLQQYTVVVEKGGFIDMATTKYVWPRKFPTLFYPIYHNDKWVIYHDIYGYHDSRDKNVQFDK